MRGIASIALFAVLGCAASVPRKAPDTEITLPDGRKLSIEQYRGRVLCLAFILTT